MICTSENIEAQRVIDLSVPIDERLWEPNPVKKEVIDHRQGADLIGKTLISFKASRLQRGLEYFKHKVGWGVDHKDFPEQKGLSLYTYRLTTHTGTHLDAPYHFGDISETGKKAKTITDIPLDWCYGNGVLLELDSTRDETVSKNELIQRLKEIGYKLRPFDIVLLKTGGDKHLGKPQYFAEFRGVSAEATEFLIDHGIKIIGVDSFGFDAPFKNMLRKYLKYSNSDDLCPAHLLGRRKEYCHIERLTNLDKIYRPYGFKVCCFPIKLVQSDAAWCRVVALMDGEPV